MATYVVTVCYERANSNQGGSTQITVEATSEYMAEKLAVNKFKAGLGWGGEFSFIGTTEIRQIK